MKLAILDRIGNLRRDGEDSIVPLQEWQPQAGMCDAIAQLTRAGWHVVLAANQPGLGRGSFDVMEFNALHQRAQREMAAEGGRIEAFFFCPHMPHEGCQCRKPAPGLLQQIATRYGAEPHEVWVIGQEASHIQAGLAFGAHVLCLQLDAQAQAALAPVAALAHDGVYSSWQAVAEALAPEALSVPPPPPVVPAASAA